MITLHSASEELRALVKWGTIIIIVLFVLLFLFRGIGILKDMFFPTPPPPPTVLFGKLPKIEIQASLQNSSANYVLDTLDGTLPAFPDRLKVYKLLSYQPSLLAPQRAQEKARQVGFITPGVPLSDIEYQWTYPNSTKNLIMDVLSLNFAVSSDYLSQPEMLASNPPHESTAITVAQEFLNGVSTFPTDLDPVKTKTTLLTVSNSELIPAQSVAATHVIRVDFYQTDLDEIPIFYNQPPFSNMSFFVGNQENGHQVLQAKFFHHSISDQSSTYPIKTADEAFEELKNGNGFIVTNFSNNTTISITNVSLGYFSGDGPQTYLMPIIVFQGTDGLYAYVSAVKNEWIQ